MLTDARRAQIVDLASGRLAIIIDLEVASLIDDFAFSESNRVVGVGSRRFEDMTRTDAFVIAVAGGGRVAPW